LSRLLPAAALLLASITVLAVPSALCSGSVGVSVPFYPMHSAVCAARSLQMVLSFYGYNYSISLLLQLMGWDYGAFYMPQYHFGYGLGEAPVQAIVEACKRLGFNATVITVESFSKAISALRHYLSQGIPVILQWRGHTVVATGITGSSVLINDPGGGIYVCRLLEDAEFVNAANALSPYTKYLELECRYGGKNVEMPLNALREVWRSWSGTYTMIVVRPLHPVTGPSRIDWARVIEEAARLEMGTAMPYPMGVAAWNALAHDLRTYFINVSKHYVELFLVTETMLSIAEWRRLDASSFLEGLAATTGCRALVNASWVLQRAADYFGRAKTLLLWAIKHRESPQARQVIEEAARYVVEGGHMDELAAKYLLEAATCLEHHRAPTASPSAATTAAREKYAGVSLTTLIVTVVVCSGTAAGVTALVARRRR